MGDLYAIMTAFCWSSAVILFDVSSKNFEPLHLNLIKNLIGVFGFILTLLVFSIPLPIFAGEDLITLSVSGLLGILIGDLFFLESLRRLGSSLVAVVGTIYVPSILILSYCMFGEVITMQSYVGAILVIIGIAFSFYKTPKVAQSKQIVVGVIFGFLANLFTAYSVLMVKPIMHNNSVIVVALYRFGIGLIACMLLAILKSGYKVFYRTLKLGLQDKYVILGSLMGTYLSVILWLAGYKYTIAGRAAIYNQLSTVLIVVWARIFLKDPIDKRKLVGVGLAITGALIVSAVKL